MNIAGIYAGNKTRKLGLLNDIANDRNAMIISLTESHLNEAIFDSEIKVDGYEVFRTDRENSPRGGILVYVKEDLRLGAQVLLSNSIANIETQILFMNKINLVFITLYRPPTAQTESFRASLEAVNKVLSTFTQLPNLVMTGDFNFPLLDWRSSCHSGGTTASQMQSELLLEFIEKHHLEQYTREPTRDRNILDLFLANNPEVVLKIEVNKTTLSDHNIITIDTGFNMVPRTIEWCKGHALADYNFLDPKIDWEHLKSEIANYRLLEKMRNASAAQCYDTILDAIEQACKLTLSPRKKSLPAKSLEIEGYQCENVIG